MDYIELLIDFVSASEKAGGSANTGDFLPMLFFILAGMSVLSCIIYAFYAKKSFAFATNTAKHCVQPNAGLGAHSPRLIFVVLLIILGLAFALLGIGTANAAISLESSHNAKAYVDEQTGEITFDQGWIKNTGDQYMKIKKSAATATGDSATILQNADFFTKMVDATVFSGKPDSSEFNVDSCPAVAPNETATLDFGLSELSVDDAKKLIDKASISLSFSYVPAECLVVYDLNGAFGDCPDSEIVSYGQLATKPTDPDALGRFFNCWCTDPEGTTPWDFDVDIVTSDITLYAKWDLAPYLEFEAVEPGSTIAMATKDAFENRTIDYHLEYEMDDGSTGAFEIGEYETPNTVITLNNPGDRVKIKASADAVYLSEHFWTHIIISGSVNCDGNTMAILYASPTESSPLIKSGFKGLFYECTGLLTAPQLPATTLSEYCYYSMFKGCSSLIVAPNLPATTLAERCYLEMFSDCDILFQAPVIFATTMDAYSCSLMFDGCVSLEVAPALPAINLAEGCYSEMFYRCSSLIQAPDLPANILADYCYYQMFYRCELLTGAPSLSAETLEKNCYNQMFSGCSSLMQAPNLPAETLAERCYFQMFSGCEILVQAPQMNAIAAAKECCYGMFQNCTSLSEVPTLSATTLAESCYEFMFFECSSLVQAPQMDATSLAYRCCSNMYSLCENLHQVPDFSVSILAEECYSNMFYGCTSLEQAPQLNATALAKNCCLGMFYLCTDLTQAPSLPVETLAESCYHSMFYGCSSLLEAPDLPATTLVTDCYKQMFYNCISLNSIKVNFTTWSDATSIWMTAVHSGGTFYCP
ncbi:MAG: InlB B-repeat-containing protein, partial [Coriobacteriales bacterium]|nr:InlB B-repeat-containing protein [Coriobacteriales bacterium]